MNWKEEHNWGLAIILIVGGLIGGLLLSTVQEHEKDMEYVKNGFCYTRLVGTDRGEWQKCK
jgi:hypothetical protein